MAIFYRYVLPIILIFSLTCCFAAAAVVTSVMGPIGLGISAGLAALSTL
jgi:hypothetical protein